MSREPYPGHLEYSIRKRVKSIENQEKPKRKTHTSTEVILRYQKKTDQQYALKLRKVEDADIIAMIDAERAKGYPTSEAIKTLIRNK